LSAYLFGWFLPRYLDQEAVAIVEGAVEEVQTLLKEPWDYIFYTGNGKVIVSFPTPTYPLRQDEVLTCLDLDRWVGRS